MVVPVFKKLWGERNYLLLPILYTNVNEKFRVKKGTEQKV